MLKKKSHHASRVPSKAVRTVMITRALQDAITLLDGRGNDLDAWSPPTAKCFMTWFGADDLGARRKIRERINKAASKLRKLNLHDFVVTGYDEYARVYPNRKTRERTIKLGYAFWSTDDKTRAGTLIHEASHFYSVGGTDDVGSEDKDIAAVDFPGKSPSKYDGSAAMYGATRAWRLALSHPRLALENADSFEFFIEAREFHMLEDEHGKPDFEGVGDFPAATATTPRG
jgi:hypothetical protein